MRYEDRTQNYTIADLRPNNMPPLGVLSKLVMFNSVNDTILTVSLSDGSSKELPRFFNFNAAMRNSFQVGARVKAFGEDKARSIYGGNSPSGISNCA